MANKAAAADIEQKVLTHVGAGNEIANTMQFASDNSWDHNQVVGVVNSLVTDFFVVSEKVQQQSYTLTKEADGYLASGSPEFHLLQVISKEGTPVSEVSKHKFGKIGLSKCMEKRWVKKDGQNIIRVVDDVEDTLQQELKALASTPDNAKVLDDKALKNLKKRKMVTLVNSKFYKVSKGPQWAPTRQRAVADLTKEMLDSGAWAEAKMKPLNLKSTGQPVSGGYLHPLMKVRAEFRKILIGMGFEEMPTNKWVESSFWNFDSLFQPQQHPARDAHDTFFLSDPKHATLASVDPAYVETVKKTHEEGGYGSIGYRYDWSLEEAKTNILRTHTTAVSAQMLYKLANQPGGFKPQKYFSIDRVFRNETVDATHLAEFHQVEGLVADYNLSLGDLIGVIETFFKALGIEKLRFKPAYNPYTEPSMEIFGYHPDLKKWTEIGNSGMFRPEMLRPMGLPENVRVIAWGLSLERPTMIKYRVDKIWKLFGHKINLESHQDFPVARFP